LLDVSHDDLFSIEGSQQAIILRNLKTRAAIARYEGHLHSITSLVFAPGSYIFASAGNSECLLWNPREHIKNTEGSHVLAEVSHPDKILDLASSENITSLSLREIGENTSTFMVAVTTDKSSSIFYAKSNGGGKASAQKNKVVKKDSLVKAGG
jgi:WD40 repeat protein